jgi:3-hydroxybutyryl-CoA dehydrogenase
MHLFSNTAETQGKHDVVYNLMEVGEGVYLPNAYIVSIDHDGFFAHIRQKALEETIVSFKLELDPIRARLFAIIEELQPKNLEKKYSPPKKKVKPLEELVADKDIQTVLLGFIHRKLDELLNLIVEHKLPLSWNVDRRGLVKDFMMELSDQDAELDVHLFFKKTRDSVLYRFQLSEGDGEPWVLSSKDVVPITNHPAWLFVDYRLHKVGAINGNMAKQVGKKLITEDDRKAALSRIKAAEKYDDLATCDLVIETAIEKEEAKRKIFSELCASLKPEAIIATNTSSISITRLASVTNRPERFIGIHFMNPVPRMQLVELIRGIATEDPTFEAARDLITALGKTVTVAEDFPAFIVNRILLPMINEAIYTLYEGVGSVDAIDTAMRLGANHPMGPLQLADFIGLDTCLSVMQVLYEGLADSKYRPCPLLVKYVEAGWLGQKTKRGFYDYRGEKPVPTR